MAARGPKPGLQRGSRATLIAIFLLVLLPVSALSALSWRVLSDERRVAKARLDELLEARLDDVRLGLEQRVIDLGQSVAREIVSAPRSIEELRALRRNLPVADELFVLEPDGTLGFPPEAGASAKELAFRQRTAAIWSGNATLWRPHAREELGASSEGSDGASGSFARSSAYRPSSASTPARGDSLLDLAARQNEGWLSWYWQDGLHIIYWRSTADGGVVGVEIDRVVLLSRLVAALPERSLAGRIELVDAKGETLHAWGTVAGRTERPDSSRHLAHPLDAWSLRYFAAPDARASVYGASLFLGTALSVSAVTLAIVLLAAWLWRTSSRAMREAGLRVSFVTQVSHELKTPLANIRMYAELLEEDAAELEEPSLSKRVGVIVSESQRLSRLIGNILSFAKQGKGEAPGPLGAVSVPDAVERVLEQFRPALEAKGFAIELEVEPAEVRAERDGLEQVLANLVGNVEKYAAAGAWLKIRTELGPDRVWIRVLDKGPGIPKRFAERVFEPFQRLSDRLDEGASGTGLGLSIARAQVESWGGHLTVEAPAEGGAALVVGLARADADEGADR